MAAHTIPNEVPIALEPLIIPPLPSEPRPEALLVFIQGGLIAAEDYVPLMKAIQEESKHLKLCVAILRCKNNVASEAEILSQYELLKAKLADLQYFSITSSGHVYFAGHSWGGLLGRVPALHLANGFIQMAAYFESTKDSLLEYPKPVLTIAGEYDGQLVLPIFAKSAMEVESGRETLGEAYLATNKPIVVISGMNHAQFAAGKVNKERGDWEAAIPIEAAHRKVAQVVASFLTVQIFGEYEPEFAESSGVLQKQVEESKKILRPLGEALDREKEGWEGLQGYLLELSYNDISFPVQFCTKILWHRFNDNFSFSKPWINRKEKTVFVPAMLNVQEGHFKQSHIMSIKLSSPSAVMLSLATSEDSGNSGPSESRIVNRDAPLFQAAARINERAIATALKSCSDEARQRYLQSGKRLKFVDDLFLETEDAWLDSKVTFSVSIEDFKTVEVQSPVFSTPITDDKLTSRVHNMKILTIAAGMEWVMVDAFR